MNRIKFCFTDGAIFCQKTVFMLLKDICECVLVDDNPDILVYSVYGNMHKHFSCKKIQVIGENCFPNFNECDYAISPHYIQFENRHCRIPFYVFNKEYQLLIDENELNIQYAEKRDFCSAVVSNQSLANPIRYEFLSKLHQQKKIMSVGSCFNTTNAKLLSRQQFAENSDSFFTNPAKIQFISKFKFNVAFENSSVNGYCTEKITDAFIARTIPIYWGDKQITNEFYEGSFINVNDFKTIDDAIDYIIEIDNDDIKYLKMLSCKKLKNTSYLKTLQAFLVNAINGEVFEHEYGNIKIQNC